MTELGSTVVHEVRPLTLERRLTLTSARCRLLSMPATQHVHVRTLARVHARLSAHLSMPVCSRTSTRLLRSAFSPRSCLCPSVRPLAPVCVRPSVCPLAPVRVGRSGLSLLFTSYIFATLSLCTRPPTPLFLSASRVCPAVLSFAYVRVCLPQVSFPVDSRRNVVNQIDMLSISSSAVVRQVGLANE